MALTQTWTDTGIAELILLLRGEPATEMEYIVALNDTDSCVAAAASTYADPAEAATHHVDEGLAEQLIDTVAGATVNTAGDTIEFNHIFTATAARNVVGIHVLNNDAGSPTVTFIECCFNALLAMENTDTLTIDGQSTIDQA